MRLRLLAPALRFALGLVLCAGAALSVPSRAVDLPDRGPSPTLERIKQSGSITFAYRQGAAPFSFRAREGRIRGYSAELCERVATSIQRELGLADLKVNWIPVDASNRIAAVATGRADAECGTTTITLSRMLSVDFSVPIYVDGGTVLVKSASKLVAFSDLKGRRIAVIGGTTTEQALRRALASYDMAATLVTVKDATAGLAQLTQGAVDGFASDRVVLGGLRLSAPNAGDFQIMAQDFSFEPYAIVLPRNDADFRLAVNRALVRLYRSGDIDPVFQRWFGGLGQPGLLLHSMFYLNTLPE